MWIELSKILPYLFYPLTVVLALIILALLMSASGRRRAAVVMIFAAFAVLLLCSSPRIASSLWSSLENQFPPLPLAAIEQAGAIVILGGGVHIPQSPRQEIEINDSGDRLLYALKLFRAGKAPLLVLTGGNVFPQTGYLGESEYSKQVLIAQGVPAGRIQLEGRSRNTYENAVETQRMLQMQGIKEIILVTSAFHMPRASGVFQRAGFDVTPASTDIRISKGEAPLLLAWLPSAAALNMFTAAWREYLGIAVYRLRGWL